MRDIAYLRDASFCALSGWAEYLSAITRREPHLLAQSAEDIRACGRAGLVILAVDRSADNLIVGSISLVPLNVTTDGRPWFELMMVYVDERYRFPITGLDIVDELHRRIAHLNDSNNLLSTTTNPSEVKSGIRVGMIHVSFTALPPNVRRATCICPADKIGVADPLTCPQCDCYCVARVSRETWERLGCPPIEAYPNL
ncbi:MAG: hypothetical protein UW63_C0078G0005 [Candidatus Uhrbacteria bacterium GW2011_GWF2_44_350]|uniref:N-acetyltransferase domain-containing protein n=1 Tax=Candidatus Uhrbacteria bacterium GW2011_GWF2_44_350 TaxID=1619000 RepID=A0A0G1M919_9BACT|nr:MAG: hypothetical protein UW63_C0078G0005 [Candidatus Uhrbacteria bacterium GW2011_GWF2_44_350]HBR80142.1 hypothetical protein [Candidatus Uhrbacteria bacterium]HCU31331.1 hypothetical protein [Candidatus Uhrbacteria bacterium]